MDDDTLKYLDGLTLGQIISADGTTRLTTDAKMLIFLNPGIINQLAEFIEKSCGEAVGLEENDG